MSDGPAQQLRRDERNAATVDELLASLIPYGVEAAGVAQGVNVRLVARQEVPAVLGLGPTGKRDLLAPDTAKKLNDAVKDRNWHWFHRYRVTDGYSTYGERAFLTFAPFGQSNYVVGQRELRVLDVMTRNRDMRIWAIAKGEDASASCACCCK